MKLSGKLVGQHSQIVIDDGSDGSFEKYLTD